MEKQKKPPSRIFTSAETELDDKGHELLKSPSKSSSLFWWTNLDQDTILTLITVILCRKKQTAMTIARWNEAALKRSKGHGWKERDLSAKWIVFFFFDSVSFFSSWVYCWWRSSLKDCSYTDRTAGVISLLICHHCSYRSLSVLFAGKDTTMNIGESNDNER